jgi:hypothetical protein
MKPGDLVRHLDGDLGFVVEVDVSDDRCPYRIFFCDGLGRADWYRPDDLSLVSRCPQ